MESDDTGTPATCEISSTIASFVSRPACAYTSKRLQVDSTTTPSRSFDAVSASVISGVRAVRRSSRGKEHPR